MITSLSLSQTVLKEERVKPDSPSTEEAGEVELVMGPRQMAGMAFVAVVAIAVFSSVAYLAGKSNAPVRTAVASAPPAPPARPLFRAPTVEPVAVIPPAPVFAEPESGKLYLQLAAVESPAASVFVEGLRLHRLRAFVAPGPDGKIVRVLVGPLENGADLNQAKAEVQKIGFDPMFRRY